MGSRRDQEIGATVARLRAAIGMTQQQLADAMRSRDKEHKWSQATVWGLEKGERSLRAAEVDDLAQALDCGPRSLFVPNVANEYVQDLRLAEQRFVDAVFALSDQLQRAAETRATLIYTYRSAAKILTQKELPEADRDNLRKWIDDAEDKAGRFEVLNEVIGRLLKEEKVSSITQLIFKGAKGKKVEPRRG